MKEKQVKKSRNQKGITLVALVVTIVVLLILAGISLNLVLGQNGIVTKAKEAKESYKTAEEKDKQDIDNLSKELELMDSKVVYSKTDKDGNVIPIPNGYYYVEGTKDTGFVISDNKNDENKANASEGNQYVWIPVDNINDYKLTSWNGEVVAEEGDENYFQNYKPSATGGGNPIQWGYILDYKESVEKYGGFYIGRYEVSFNTTENKIESKKDKVPYTNQEFDIMRSMIMEFAGNINNGENAKEDIDQGNRMVRPQITNELRPTMMLGKQWDAMIRWLNKTKGSEYNSIGHIGSSSINTGSNETYKINNIYDIAGNVAEYVNGDFFGTKNGSSVSISKVYRGGNYTQENLSANSRSYNDGSASPEIGTRLSLILPMEPVQSDTDEGGSMDDELGGLKR